MKNIQDILREATEAFLAGKVDYAEKVFDQLLCQVEDDPNIYFAYGTLLCSTHKFSLAIMLLRKGLALYDKHPLGWCNLATTLKYVGKADEAMQAYQKAYDLDPNMPEVLAGISGFWINRNNPEKVVEFARRALAVNPNLQAAKMNLSMGLLEQGKFDEAWPYYEARRSDLSQNCSPRPYKCPEWRGDRVKLLSIHGEQGLGDEILFMACFRKAAERADRVIVECADRLVPLFARSFGVPCYATHKELIAAEGEPDAYIPMGSLPLVVGMPDGRSFLKPRGSIFNTSRRPRVGIAWSGGSMRTSTYDRSITLDEFKPILSMTGVDFVSVQYGDHQEEEVAAVIQSPYSLDFETLTDTIASCDLIISVCQTAVHQAGGLGVPCWVLVPKKSAWRYCGNNMRPWYNSVKFYRKPGPGLWGKLIEQVAQDLGTWLSVEEMKRAS